MVRRWSFPCRVATCDICCQSICSHIQRDGCAKLIVEYTTADQHMYVTHQSNCIWVLFLRYLRQHRTIWQEHSAKDFASYESYKRAGILYVFPPFITARMGQKIGRRPQTQLCGDALKHCSSISEIFSFINCIGLFALRYRI